MTGLRLLADDLTGALDAGAEFATAHDPLSVFWHGALPATPPTSAAVDSGTREMPPDEAAVRVTALTPLLAGADLAFKKIDSLMRGPTLAELAACFAAGRWRHAILAPAFPHQGRITRDGRQLARDAAGGWTPAGPELTGALRALGVPAQTAAGALQPGITVFDAETDAALDDIAARFRHHPDLLWCGTAGLARALAARDAVADATLPGPILGLFGSDQNATRAQLDACGRHHLRLPPHAGHDGIARLLETQPALVSLDLPPNLPRDLAATQIAAALHAICAHLPQPGTLLVAGGETLRALCQALGATHLALHGRISPGLPRSVLCGGRWHGTVVVSKSGAFGPPGLLRDLLHQNGFNAERMD